MAKAYEQGYLAALKDWDTALPKQCVNWWFKGEDLKARHKEAQAAFCKGRV